MAQLNRHTRRRGDVFKSVFIHRHSYAFSDPSFVYSAPTAAATPVTTFSAPGELIGGNEANPSKVLTNLHDFDNLEPPVGEWTENRPAEHQVIWDRSWHVVTNTLLPANFPFIPYGLEPQDARAKRTQRPRNFLLALDNVLNSQSRLPALGHREDLVTWLLQHTRAHFMSFVRPFLAKVARDQTGEVLLRMTFQALERADELYQGICVEILDNLDRQSNSRGRAFFERRRVDFHTLARSAVPDTTWNMTEWYLAQSINTVLSISLRSEAGDKFSSETEQERAREDLLNFVGMVARSGLAGERFLAMVADLMNSSMSAYVQGAFSHSWNARPTLADASKPADRRLSRHMRNSLAGNTSILGDEELVPRGVNHTQASRCVQDLCSWTEEKYARLAIEILNATDSDDVSYADLQNWKEMCIGRLAELRTSELFDIVVNWPNSQGALDDLKTAITTPKDRLLLTDTFTYQLKQRLLHPGATTLEILRVYISMIRSFHALDHSKVLLDRVAFPLQVYLCSREDTARVIITGLLADSEDEDGNEISFDPDRLVELAVLLHKGSDAETGPDDEVDWSDMTWVPDPVDAGPGYKRSKTVDVIGTLINVLGSREVFSKEFQKILGENLLKNIDNFANEARVLHLLKSKLGEDELQSHEVMLKDIHDSFRLDDIIVQEQGLDQISPNDEGPPAIHTKMLSRFFWPQLKDDEYKVPDIVAHQLHRYEVGFEKVKATRKLTWLHALGQATIELDLKDRTMYEECHTYQATVIYAFHSEDENKSVTRTFDELYMMLQMDEDMLGAALRFWIKKWVISHDGAGNYTVLEVLDAEQRERAQAGPTEGGATGTNEEVVKETKLSAAEESLHWSFVEGMLKNSAAQMPVSQIRMMMAMLIPDFAFDEHELVDWLNGKVESGDLELVAGKYRLGKK